MMKNMKKRLFVASLGIAAALAAIGHANAQIAGSTTIGVAVTEMVEITRGWSAKKSILGKTLYNDVGEKVGKVEDLIVSPEKNVSYLIIGAGGFIGVGRHDVAIPMTQIREQEGRIVLSGATKDAVKALPRFDYADNTITREQFVAKAEKDIAKAKDMLADVEKKAAAATGEAKTKMGEQIAVLQQDLKTVEQKLTALKNAGADKWKEFEKDTRNAITRLHRSLGKLVG